MTQAPDIKPRSRDVTDGLEKTAARGMLRAVGFHDDDFASRRSASPSCNDITPCNAHLDRLARKAVEGIRAGGGVPHEFGTPPRPTAS